MKTHAWTIVPMLRRTLAVLATTLAAMTTANAALVRFDFTGTVTSSQIGDPLGNVLTGWLQFDTTLGTATAAPVTVNARTYTAAGPQPDFVAGQWSVAGGSSGSVGDGGYFSQTVQVVRLPPSTPNSNERYSIDAFDQASASDMSDRQAIILTVVQALPPTGIFDTPSSLDLFQHVNWFNPGSLRFSQIETADGVTGFLLRTMTTSVDGAVRDCQEAQAGLCDALAAAEVPEPGTLTLLGAALGALAVARRRRPRA